MTEKTDKRVYIINQRVDDDVVRPDRYINASTPIQAVMHVSKDFFPARIATHAELRAAFVNGVEIEEAVEHPRKRASEPT